MTIQLCSIKNSLLTPGFGRNFMQIKKSCRRSWLRRLRPSAARLPRTLHLFRGHTSEEEGPVQCGRGRGPKTRRWGRGRDGEQPGCFPRPPAKCLACRGRPSAASGARAQPGWRLPSDESAKAEPHGDQRGPGDRRLLSAGRRHCSAPVFLEPVLCHLSCARGFSTPPSVPTAPRLITANVFNQRHMFSEVKIRRR